jgi:uncharacterized protein (TIGR00255 family)
MKSMTGYAYRESRTEGTILNLELKSYNNRYFDLVINIPSFLGPLEPRFREYLSARVQRGRVEFSLKVKELEEHAKVVLDRATAAAYAETLRELIGIAGLEDKLRLSHLLPLEGILKLEKARDPEAYWSLVTPLLSEVFEEYERSREREGEILERDIMNQLESIERNLAVIESFAPQLERNIKDSLRTRFLELDQAVDESRVYAETARRSCGSRRISAVSERPRPGAAHRAGSSTSSARRSTARRTRSARRAVYSR